MQKVRSAVGSGNEYVKKMVNRIRRTANTAIIYSSPLSLSPLVHLPQDVLAHIFSYLDITTLSNLSLVCRYIRSVADFLPWRRYYINRIGLCFAEPIYDSSNLTLVYGQVFPRWLTNLILEEYAGRNTL